MIYNLTPELNMPTTFVLHVFGKPFALISGGSALQIFNTFSEVKRFDERRADDFMHGVHLGLMYAPLTGQQVQLVATALPDIPTWPPRVTAPPPLPVQQTQPQESSKHPQQNQTQPQESPKHSQQNQKNQQHRK